MSALGCASCGPPSAPAVFRIPPQWSLRLEIAADLLFLVAALLEAHGIHKYALGMALVAALGWGGSGALRLFGQ